MANDEVNIVDWTKFQHSFVFSCLHFQVFRLATWFITKIQTNRPGLNVGGFFVITKELMLTVIH